MAPRKKATRKKSTKKKKPPARKPAPANASRKKSASPKKSPPPLKPAKRKPAPKAKAPTKRKAPTKAKKPTKAELARKLDQVERATKRKKAQRSKRQKQHRAEIRDLGYGPGVIPIGFRPGHAPRLRTKEERDEALKNGRARLRSVATRLETHLVDDGYDVDGRAAQHRKKIVAAAVALSITSPGERYLTPIVFNSLESAFVRTLRALPQDILFERLYVQLSAVYDVNETTPVGLKRYTWDEPSRTLYTGVHSLRNYGDAISSLEVMTGRSHPKAIKVTLSYIN